MHLGSNKAIRVDCMLLLELPSLPRVGRGIGLDLELELESELELELELG